MKTSKQPTTAAVRVNPVIKKGTKMGGGAIKRNTLLWLKNAYFPQNEQKIMLHNCIFLLSSPVIHLAGAFDLPSTFLFPFFYFTR